MFMPCLSSHALPLAFEVFPSCLSPQDRSLRHALLVVMEPSDAYRLIRAKRVNLPTVFQARTSMGAPFRGFLPHRSRRVLSDSAVLLAVIVVCLRSTRLDFEDANIDGMRSVCGALSRGRNHRSSLGCFPSLRGFEPCGLVYCFQQTPLVGFGCRRFPVKGPVNIVLFRVSENRPGRPDSRRVSLHGLLIVAAPTCVGLGDSEERVRRVIRDGQCAHFASRASTFSRFFS